MDKIKIVFILGTLDIGGAERQFIEILRRLNRTYFDLRVLAFACHGRLRTEIEALHVSFDCLEFSGLKGKFHPGSYWQLYTFIRDMVRYFRREQPQIVQSYLFWTNIFGCIAAKIAGVPVIITGRRATMEERYKKFPQQWLQNLTNLWTTTIIANSRIVKQQCLRQEKYVTEEKILVIYNGLDPGNYMVNIDKAEKKRALQIPDASAVVGIIASLHPRKGHADFLKAAAVVLQTHPHTIFLLIGRDEGIRTTLEALAKELGISNAVIFTGERDDVPELLAILDVLVSSSLLEGLSNAILEGMAAGKPIVATTVSGTPELVVHEETGLLVSPGNPSRLAEAITRLLSNDTLQTQMGRAGRERVAQLFGMKRMIEQTETLYQDLVTTYCT